MHVNKYQELYDFVMPTHIPNMPSTLTITMILQQIEDSMLHTIPQLIQHLLMSNDPDYQTLTSAI